MIDLRQMELPTAIEVNGRKYEIYTDFRKWFDFENIMKNLKDKPDAILRFFVSDYPMNDEDWGEALEKLNDFYLNPNSTPKKPKRKGRRTVDFIEDGEYLVASFLQVYNINLLAYQMHWHLFLALFRGLPSSCRLAEIMQMRGWVNRPNKKPERFYEEARDAWALPNGHDSEQEELEAEMERIFWGA